MGELIAQLSEDRSDPELLVEAARRSLRESCLVADIGISEAAIAVAETGTCILASDGGDDRLVTLLPRLHVTLIDQASLVATWETAMAGLRGLHRDEEGWRMPSFVTYLSGRNTTGDIPGALMARAQGPEAEHIVLLEMS
jgi:L-lactate dehydrogenase complex protein LldG